MNDITFSESETDTSDFSELLDQQYKMEKEWQDKQVVAPIRYDSNVHHFFIPAYSHYLGKTLSLPENANVNQKLIFSALYTAYYLYFYSDEFFDSTKATFATVIPNFISYLNKYQFSKENKILVLKDFETYRVTVDKVKTQCSGLQVIIRCIRVAIDYKEFRNQLNDIDYAYFHTLIKTKCAPYDEHKQTTMTEWFGKHTWLRRDDVGICHDLYTRLASPKALITSFRITIVTSLLEIQSAKYALISFFKKNKWMLDDIPIPKDKSKFDTHGKWVVYCYQLFAQIMNRLRKVYNEYGEIDEDLTIAIKMIIFDIVHEHSQDTVFQSIKSNKEVTYTSNDKYVFTISNTPTLFSFTFLRDLISYANSSASDSVPITNAEHILFSWLMAYKTVQPSDIPKLASKNFKFIRRRKGQITHIEIQYYKGRAGTMHSLEMMETKTELGTAVLHFLQEKGDFDEKKNPLKVISAPGSGKGTEITKLISFCHKGLKNKIDKKLTIENASTVFLDAMVSLKKSGIRYDSKVHKTVKNYQETIDTPISKVFFGLTAIKNTSIHSRSDTFTPTQLLNYHSHTNETERDSYLSPQNEEWLNNCGRITRAVMQDLTVNLFRASEKEKQQFNSQFIKSSEIIDVKRDDILSRMKLITGKQEGSVDELGFTHIDNQSDMSIQSDSVYLVDSQETVLKLKHYLAEVKKTHNLLLDNAPEFLLFTVLPTVEWIEILFEQKKFSKKTLFEGNGLYKQYQDILPPLFTAQIGG